MFEASRLPNMKTVSVASNTCSVIEAVSEAEAAERGVQEVVDGRSAALMKGWVYTDVLMHPVGAGTVADRAPGEPRIRSRSRPLSQAAAGHRCGDQHRTRSDDQGPIVQNVMDPARLLGIEMPNVAALSAVEVVKPAIASTIDAACLSKMVQREQTRHVVVGGPWAFDNAISREAALTKRIDSPVAGEGDILLAPDLAFGNLLAKDLE